VRAAPARGPEARLAVMMFLQYAIWGAWLPILYPFLMGHRRFDLDQVGLVLAAGAAGALVGPFIAGQIADRHAATERFLALLHAVGAVLVWMIADTADFGTFLGLSLLYGLVYAPTLSLTNSLALHHLPDRDRDFGRVRLWGTIGWIVAGIAVGQWLALRHSPAGAGLETVAAAQDAGRADAFRLSSMLGLVLAGFALFLPHTPPARFASTRNAAAAALRAAGRQPLFVLFLLAVPISCIHQFYFVYTSDFLSRIQREATAADALARGINAIFGVGGGGLMTIGQMSEILVLGLVPVLAARLSRKSLLMIGILAYALRMAIFANTTWMPAVLLGVALHGLCFGCFIFVAFMIVDEETTPDVRASAQSLFNLVIVGVGIIVGSMLATRVVGTWARVPVTGPDGLPRPGPDGRPLMAMDYGRLFGVPMWASLACLVILILFYPRRRAAPRLVQLAPDGAGARA
jgi:nucleoside transporter